MQLPNTKSTVKSNFLNAKTLIVGAGKTGKSTFASQLGENVLFLATEQGLDYLEVFKIDIKTYKDFQDAIQVLTTTKHSYKTICIDILDKLIEMAENEVCARNKVPAIKDMAYGSGQVATKKLIFTDLDKLNNAGFGIIMICHQREKEFKTEAISWTAMGTSLSKSYDDAFLGFVDLILYVYANSSGKRMLRTKPNKYCMAAGDRSNKLPEVMELDAKKVLEIFNQQPTTTQKG